MVFGGGSKKEERVKVCVRERGKPSTGKVSRKSGKKGWTRTGEVKEKREGVRVGWLVRRKTRGGVGCRAGQGCGGVARARGGGEGGGGERGGDGGGIDGDLLAAGGFAAGEGGLEVVKRLGEAEEAEQVGGERHGRGRSGKAIRSP